MMRREEVEEALNMVTGNFSIRTHFVEFLFDFGAMHLFISARVVEMLWLVSMSRYSLLSITLLDGKVVDYRNLYIDCPIVIHGHGFLADLYKFELIEFDLILGMYWLSKHQAHINCLKRKITLTGLC